MADIEAVLEVLLLLALPWPVWRLLGLSALWQARRQTAIELLGLSVIYAAAVVILAIHYPLLLRLGALIAAAGVFLLWMRSLPHYGRRKNWPPGRLTVLPRAPVIDHRFYQHQAVRYGPVFKMASPLPYITPRPMVCVVGHELGLEVLQKFDNDLRVAPEMKLSRHIPKSFLRYMDREDHAVYSKLFHAAFADLKTPEWEPILANEANIVLSDMAKDSIAASNKGVDPRPYMDSMMFAILARLLLNIERGSDAFTRLQACRDAINHPRLTRMGRDQALKQTLEETLAFLRREFSRQGLDERRPDQESLTILDKLIRADRDAIGDATILGNLLLMLDTGCNDVTGLLVWVLKLLTDHPQFIKRLNDSLTMTAPKDETLSRDIISETLRLEQSEYLYRRTMRAIQIGKYNVPKGWVLRICIREGHQDANNFADPEKYDPDRFCGKNYGHTEYAPFGLFRHRCMGEEMARTICRVLITDLFRNYACKVTQDGPRELINFHWQPNRNFSLSLIPRLSEPQSSTMP